MTLQKPNRKGKGGPKPKAETIARREKILSIIKSIGLWNISITELGLQLKVSRETIYRDLEEIKKHTSFDSDDVKFNLDFSYKKIISKSLALIANKNTTPGVVIQAMQTLNHASKGYIEMLESFGIKKKVADDVNINSYSTNINAELSKAEKKDLLELVKKHEGEKK